MYGPWQVAGGFGGTVGVQVVPEGVHEVRVAVHPGTFPVQSVTVGGLGFRATLLIIPEL